MGPDWPERLTWAEYAALTERYNEQETACWKRSSLVATAIYNVNRGPRADALPSDYFAPRAEATTDDTTDVSEETDEQQQARLDRLYLKAVKASALINRAQNAKKKQGS